LIAGQRAWPSLGGEADCFRLAFTVFSDTQSTVSEFLACRVTQHHGLQLLQLCEKGNVRIEGEIVPAMHSVRKGQKVTLDLPNHYEDPVNTNWHMIWQNDEIMKVYKPPLLPVSRTTRNLYHTLISLIRRETPYGEAQLLHRMDTETSGELLIAKHSSADKKWKKQLDRLIVKKRYHAWVEGVPAWDSMTLECLLSEKEGSLIRSQMYVVDPDAVALYRKPKFSKTAFSVLQRLDGRSLIACDLFTGRKHQIRAHLAHLGHPIVGDKIYSLGGKYYLKRLCASLTAEDYAALGAEHHLLEAVALELDEALLLRKDDLEEATVTSSRVQKGLP